MSGWRRITDAVHAKGGLIVLQIGHDGRQSHADLSNGAAPVAPSVVPFEGQAFTRDGWVPVSPHRALETDEIPLIIESFRAAAEQRSLQDLMGSSCTMPTAISPTRFCKTGPTSEPTAMAAILRAGPVSRLNWSRR